MATMNGSDRYDAGLAVRREVLGEAYVDQAIEGAAGLSLEFQQFVTEHCWGAVWTRPGIDRRIRSMLNLAMLPALKQWDEFKLHLSGAINNGVTPQEICEVLLQVTVYCGVPAGVEAFRIAKSQLPALSEIVTDAD
jgi:4-carboxymuconolactone decarboxylase